eukprot:CAMPEP_0115142776 /NCGR_PEP_ID=MMETSP0227-20121206/60364_1 /TAXON_ID=89957 /ORGANISM="Polarella glacialis, Strain CCMP 1383" /LENGTH=467 /DNA_ID=CAMNT_0002551453 /DNA_START=113 /DNA_END=1516 /DNA_ORIENTATION=+
MGGNTSSEEKAPEAQNVPAPTSAPAPTSSAPAAAPVAAPVTAPVAAALAVAHAVAVQVAVAPTPAPAPVPVPVPAPVAEQVTHQAQEVPATVGVQPQVEPGADAAEASKGKNASKGGKGGERAAAATKGGSKRPGKVESQGVQLCIRNLTKDSSPEQLRMLFSPFGELQSVDVKKNQDGSCRGFGFVTFLTIEDATKAISVMNNKGVEGKTLAVVLSDRQQGVTKADRESTGEGKGKGKGKGSEAKGGKDGKGKGGGKEAGKGMGKPAPIQTNLQASAPVWPYGQMSAAEMYAYAAYGNQMMSPYAQQAYSGYPQPSSPAHQQAAAMQALQAHMLHQAQQAQAMQAQAYYSGLTGGVVPGAAALSAATSAGPGPAESFAVEKASTKVKPPAGKEFEGILKSISSKNGYGFIDCPETHALYGRDVFVDSALLPEGMQVKDRVIFSLALSEKGHPRATAVRLVGKAGAR